jgi:hypothetical protein
MNTGTAAQKAAAMRLKPELNLKRPEIPGNQLAYVCAVSVISALVYYVPGIPFAAFTSKKCHAVFVLAYDRRVYPAVK